jgi:hypothetical protein
LAVLGVAVGMLAFGIVVASVNMTLGILTFKECDVFCCDPDRGWWASEHGGKRVWRGSKIEMKMSGGDDQADTGELAGN